MSDVDGGESDGEVGHPHHHARHHHGEHAVTGEEAGGHLAPAVPPEVEVRTRGHGDPHDEDDQQRAAVAQRVVHDSCEAAGVEHCDQGSVEEISLQH